MSLLINREVILVKAEASYRNATTPTVAANEVRVENLSVSFNESLVMIEPRPVKAGFVPPPHTVSSALATLSFDAELKGAAAGVANTELSDLMKVCGWSEAISAGASVTYKPASTSIPSATAWWYTDGILHKIDGARGNVTFSAEAGQRMMLHFTLTGHLMGNPTDAALVTPTYSAIIAQPFQGATFTIDGYAAVVTKLEFDGGAKLIMPKSINSADGFGEIQIVGPREITGSFDPEHVVVATEAFLANWRASTSMVLTTGLIGGTAGNRVTVSMPVVRYRELTPADRDGLRTYDASFQAYDSAGDDAVSIAIT